MKYISIPLLTLACLGAKAQTFVSTDAYTWRGDTIFQNEFVATAPDASTIVSTYSAQPGYFMPIEKEWHRKNDISMYPQLKTPNTLHTAIYNMGLDEMVNAVEPDTTLRTGREWPGVWTRDVSYSILLSMAYMQPEASRISLMHKVNLNGRIIQDTGSGGAWPVSTDRVIWAVAAYEVYKVTGDKKWLEYIYPVIKNSLYDDRDAGYYNPSGLMRGETSFIDWREQSYPKWMQTADIYQSQALSTSVVHARAWEVLGLIAEKLGHKDVAADAFRQSQTIADAINRELWMDDKGIYAMYTYGRDNLILNPRAETLGLSLAVEWGVAPADRAERIAQSSPITPFGPAVFFPQSSDMPAYHNNALWPWVASYWGLASARARNPRGVVNAIGSVFRPAALFATNKENLNLDNGDIATELNSSNMLWCLAGNIALTHKVLFGIDFTDDGLAFHPFVPSEFAAKRSLDNFKYRGATLNITVEGYGDSIASFTVNGKAQQPLITPKQAVKAGSSPLNIVIRMADNVIPDMPINATKNIKAPLTPIARIEDNTLVWNPIEYIHHYLVLRNGQVIDSVTTTTYPAQIAGEYQVIGVNEDGTQSFASEPMSNRRAYVAQFGGEQTLATSSEIAYTPQGKITGYTGSGFCEVDKATAPVSVTLDIPEAGRYAVTLRYANGNGPVNTENRCAIRTLLVDGAKAGTMVMPQRGRANWNDWGRTNSVEVNLTAGQHTFTIEMLPENRNMNLDTNHALIDCLTVTRL